MKNFKAPNLPKHYDELIKYISNTRNRGVCEHWNERVNSIGRYAMARKSNIPVKKRQEIIKLCVKVHKVITAQVASIDEVAEIFQAVLDIPQSRVIDFAEANAFWSPLGLKIDKNIYELSMANQVVET